jgi:hypothetical protein
MFLMSAMPSARGVIQNEDQKLTISVPWTINVTIVPCICFILNVRGVNGDTASFLFGSLVNRSIVGELRAPMFRKNLGNGSSQRSLSMINVT